MVQFCSAPLVHFPSALDINHHLLAYCHRNKINFTRSRPYKKNDSAHIEQKNWTVVRRLVGYDRYSSEPAFNVLRRLYSLLRLHVNFFQPVMKLQSKTRHGAKVRKVYDRARTPYQRLLESGNLTEDRTQRLATIYAATNPVQLRAQIEDTLTKLWGTADRTNVSKGLELGSLVTA